MIVPGQIDVLTSSTFDSFRTFALFPCQESRMMVPPCHIMPYHPSRQPWGSPSHRMSRWGLSVPIVLFFGSDGLRSPRHLRVSFHIMVTSLQRVWSVADFSTDVRATLGSSSCFSAEPLGGGWGGVRVSGGGGGVITSCQRLSWRSSWSCNIPHPTFNMLLMLRCGTSSCNI